MISIPKNLQDTPFRYQTIQESLDQEEANNLLEWLDNDAPWKLKIAEFYEQYEFSFQDKNIPEKIKNILSEKVIEEARLKTEEVFRVKLSKKVEITAHKLSEGQTIRIHNDFIPGQESHRLLIQLNNGWSQENGGLLMLFDNEAPISIHRAILPIHNTGFIFEISKKSLHAVSTIKKGNRYTLVISFFMDSPYEQSLS